MGTSNQNIFASSFLTLQNQIEHHPSIENLRKNSSKLQEDNCENIFAYHDGILLVWNTYKSEATTIKLTRNDPQHSDVGQVLKCTNPPKFKVQKIQLNDNGNLLALIGKRCVSVLEIPTKWGKDGEFEGGKQEILCMTIPIGERFFYTHSKTNILYAAWHPGSETRTHLVILTSDGYISIYDTADPLDPVLNYALPGQVLNGSTMRNTSFTHALGEAAVAFDFGPPCRINIGKNNSAKTISVWPTYVLMGNGDVYCLYMDVYKRFEPYLAGPLRMQPPAEDNYGTDACGILCIDTKPPVLVISTGEGSLYHCITLDSDDPDDDLQTEAGSARESAFPEPVLYVYENVLLELSLTTTTLVSDEVVEDNFTCPIHLVKDPVTSSRYHCFHKAGVHSIAIPWTANLQKFVDGAENGDPQFSYDDNAIVEHLICTKPLPSSSPLPIRGLCICNGYNLGTNLICLTAALDCVVLPLVSKFKSEPKALLSNDPTEKHFSPLRKVIKEPFEDYIQRLLQRNSGNPLLKASSKTELTPQECFRLLSRSTQVYREEYLQKQELAQEEIERRIKILKEEKELQLKDLSACEKEKTKLRQSAEILAERYDEMTDRQKDIIQRTEKVMVKLQKFMPLVSDSEKVMVKDLKAIEEKLNDFNNKLEQIKSKQRYQKKMIDTEATSTSSPVISNPQSQRIKSCLKEEGDAISELVSHVKELKLQAGV